MPSSRGLHIAQLAKEAFDKGTTTNMDQHVPLEYLLRDSSNTNTLDVPFDSVADATDANYNANFETVHTGIKNKRCDQNPGQVPRMT
jgi:hypothetical protein